MLEHLVQDDHVDAAVGPIQLLQALGDDGHAEELDPGLRGAAVRLQAEHLAEVGAELGDELAEAAGHVEGHVAAGGGGDEAPHERAETSCPRPDSASWRMFSQYAR